MCTTQEDRTSQHPTSSWNILCPSCIVLSVKCYTRYPHTAHVGHSHPQSTSVRCIHFIRLKSYHGIWYASIPFHFMSCFSHVSAMFVFCCVVWCCSGPWKHQPKIVVVFAAVWTHEHFPSNNQHTIESIYNLKYNGTHSHIHTCIHTCIHIPYRNITYMMYNIYTHTSVNALSGNHQPPTGLQQHRAYINTHPSYICRYTCCVA